MIKDRIYDNLLPLAKEVLALEARCVADLAARLDDNFIKAVDLILKTKGKVITTGIGKSGIVAQKITATLNSTGTKSIFLHPVEALHGDLGSVDQGDIVLALSNSGETYEILNLLPRLSERKTKLIALTGGLNSALAKAAHAVLDCAVEREACSLGLAPTSSTTATLAMGDALAVALLHCHGFKAEDFRRHHPGGRLGERLSLKVHQVMLTGGRIPKASPQMGLLEAIDIMDRRDLGTLLIMENDNLLGIFTDGDLRRAVLAGQDLANTTVGQIMVPNPLAIDSEALAVEALNLMEEKEITALPIVDKTNKNVVGIVHLHDLLGRGQVSFQNLTEQSGE